MRHWKTSLMVALCCGVVGAQPLPAQLVRPSVADPQVRRFNAPSVVIAGTQTAQNAPLAVFLTGTGGSPQRVEPLLRVIAGQGYRVIGLSYDDEPSVIQACHNRSDPDCTAATREMRSFGTTLKGTTSPLQNSLAESVTARLAALLAYLKRSQPASGWGQYLQADGQPAWDRLVLSGHSQGAGMAAYIAKRYAVARVVLFSSPWDDYGPDQRLAPWLSDASATPPERWWAERNTRELTTGLIAKAYQALQIPADHILLFNRDLPPGMALSRSNPNPYHSITVKDTGYAPQWRTLYGTP